jgi:imidazolonepropionase-like amidohydrolase
VLINAAVLDPEAGELVEGQTVVVEGDRVAETGPTAAVSAGDAAVLDVRGMTVMPGLIDAHVHVTAATADLEALEGWSPSYVTARAAGILRGMLDRGFTTVRDVAGADFGIAAAVAEGLLAGPRVRFGGKALSQTGGTGILAGLDGWCSTSTRAARLSPPSPTASPRCAGRPGSSCGGGHTTSR